MTDPLVVFAGLLLEKYACYLSITSVIINRVCTLDSREG